MPIPEFSKMTPKQKKALAKKSLKERDEHNKNMQTKLKEAKTQKKRASEKTDNAGYSDHLKRQHQAQTDILSGWTQLARDMMKSPQNLEEEEEEEYKIWQADKIARPRPPKCKDRPCNTSYVKQVVDNLIHDITSDIDNIQSKAYLLMDTVYTKTTILNNLKKDAYAFNKNQNRNTNFVVTTGRLTHFYNDNIKGQNTQNNVLKLAFITVFAVFLLLFKNEIKAIFKGTPEHRSIFVQPELPAIACVIFMIVYLVWLFNNKNIREVSYYMIATFLGYILFIQYSSIKLANNPLKPGLFGAAIIPFVLYFIIEKLNLDHNIIPIYKKNTKIAYKLNDEIQSLERENSEVTQIIKDYDKLHSDLS